MSIIKVRPIIPGYAFKHVLTVTGLEAFTGKRVVGQFRTKVDDASTLATADTGTGTLAVLAADSFEIRLTKEQTASFPVGLVDVDFIVIDGSEQTPLPFRISWPVRKSVTRGVT